MKILKRSQGVCAMGFGRKRYARISLLCVFFGFFFLFPFLGWSGLTEIKSIEFDSKKNPLEIKVQATEFLVYTKKEGAVQGNLDHFIELEFENAVFSKEIIKKIKVLPGLLIKSVFPSEEKGPKVKVFVELSATARSEVSQIGQNLMLKIFPEKFRSPAQALERENPEPSLESSSGSNKVGLDQFFNEKETQNFTGKPITLQVRDADATDVLRMIGEASGFNMLIGDDVKGKLTLSLQDVPWDQALDVIMQSLRLGADRKDSILRVMTLQSLLAEKKEQQQTLEAVKAASPRVTRIFSISYANLGELAAALTAFASSSSHSGNSGESKSLKGLVQADERTNSLIVEDTPENVEKMKKLIEILDTQTPQVMIETRVVEASEGFTKSFGGSLGVGGDSFVGSFSGGDPIDPLFGTPGVFAGGSSVSKAGTGTLAFSPSLKFLPKITQLNAILNFAESDNLIKVVASPKTVVLNKQQASIVSGTPVQVPGTTFVAGVGSVPTTNVQQARVSLDVTPTVTNDGAVQLKLNLSKDLVFNFSGTLGGIGNRTMSTLVLVDSGSTLVIGGIYSLSSTESSSGFPFLRKLPLFGFLFGNESSDMQRSELFFFVTPKILNQKEAGLNG